MTERLQKDFAVVGTLGCPSIAAFGGVAETEADLLSFRRQATDLGLSIYWLGEGSNIVPHEHIQGVVIQVGLTGVDCIAEGQDFVIVRVGAGVNWHEFVQQSLNAGWYGLENLALIPGSVGAVPVQNVGAYGVEVDQFVHAVHIQNEQGETTILTNSECEFAYRDSIFKRQPGWVITAVDFKLPTQDAPNLSYAEVAQELLKEEQVKEEQVKEGQIKQARPTKHSVPTAQAVFDAVVRIRSKKLPEPAQYANVGSFFKNPIVTMQQAADLKSHFPDLKQFEYTKSAYDKEGYPASSHQESSQSSLVKLSAAQLIDKAGGKLLERSNVHCWPTQPLVLINSEHAIAAEVLEFAALLQQKVEDTFAVTLHIEPQIWS